MAKKSIVTRIKEKVARGLRFSRLGGIGLPVFKSFQSTSNVDGMFIPFSGSGLAIPTQNKFPETLAKIAADSPTHGAAVKAKSSLTFGQGFNNDELPKDVKEWFDEINENGDTANDVLECVAEDYAHFQGFALKVRWTGKKTIADVEHVRFKNVRIGKPENGKVTYFIISNNWARNLPTELEVVEKVPAFDPSKISEAKIIKDEKGNETTDFDQTTKENGVQLIYYVKYSAASDGFYPVPDYIQCLDAAITEVDTGIAMRNGLDNGIQGATVISSNTDTPLDNETKQNVADTLDEIATGAANAQSLIFMPANVNITQLKPVDADTFKETNSESKQRIVTGHRIPAILLEISLGGGGFNNRAEEMKTAISMFQETTILSYQQKITRVFNSILKFVTEEDVNLRIIPFLEGRFEDKKEGESKKEAPIKEGKNEAKDETNLTQDETV